ncbi:fad linked oxidase-like protein [Diplodia corticola]|uniref:Fad linked oxidase-like protein n=1 Tax=Diplodia corticola TaxID=236234 RepID=A0A1J9S7H4_9PEZI|nr:fad linked oxidase-like protein [Diplodia corticola]OJD36447.1 fad linked oxidase-like protein [Diplodia corticola]
MQFRHPLLYPALAIILAVPWTRAASGSEQEVLVQGSAVIEDGCAINNSTATLLADVGLSDVPCEAATHISTLLESASACPPMSSNENGEPPCNTDHERAELACALARLALQPAELTVRDAESPFYDDDVRVNWSTDCHLHPTCILSPLSTSQTSTLALILSRTHTPFALRSGGHNPNPGFASIAAPGILISTARLTSISLSPDSSTATVGPGNRWLDVYAALEGTGRTVLGGRTPDVGVGGLLVGCGIPNFAGSWGLACGRVRGAEVVLGDGRVVWAGGEEEGGEREGGLLWGLRGGGANFGIVTAYELETLPMEHIWYESRIYGPEQSRRLLKAVRQYQEAAEEDPRSSFAFSLSNNHTIVAWIYSEPVERPDVFSMFYDIPFERHFIEPSLGTPYTLAKAFETVLGDRPAFKRDIIAVSTKPDLSLYEEAYEAWLDISQEMMSKFDCMMTFGIQPVTSSTVKITNRKSNPLNLSPESQQWFTSVIQWQDDSADALAHEAVHRSGGAMRDIARRKGLLLDFVFLNDATWDQSPLASYGSANLEKLRELSQRYDPLRVFQKLQGNGFLLDKA